MLPQNLSCSLQACSTRLMSWMMSCVSVLVLVISKAVVLRRGCWGRMKTRCRLKHYYTSLNSLNAFMNSLSPYPSNRAVIASSVSSIMIAPIRKSLHCLSGRKSSSYSALFFLDATWKEAVGCHPHFSYLHRCFVPEVHFQGV